MKSKYSNLNSKQRRRIRTEVCRRDNYICQYCGIDLLSSKTLYHFRTVDHVHPTSNGGDSLSIENMVCCCALCNNMKGDYTLGSIEQTRRYIESKQLEVDARYTIEKKQHRRSLLRRVLSLLW